VPDAVFVQRDRQAAPQVAQRQSPDVDTISGATQSGDAFYYAVLDALYLAK
jgi:uncharacterized protein with FMN-binding domain